MDSAAVSVAAAAAAADGMRKGKRPMFPEDELLAADAADAKHSFAPGPEGGEGERKPQVRTEGGAGVEANGEAGVEANGEAGDLVLVAECGTELRASRPAARMSTMLRGMMEGDCAAGRIAIPDVPAGVLRTVLEYCERHAPHYDPDAAAARDRDPFPPFPIDLAPSTHAIRPVTEPEPDPHGLEAWDKEFIAAVPDNSTLFGIILAANYLGVDDLIDLGCTAVADKMRGKKPEEIRAIFEIENDYTPEQEAEVRKENAWAFED
ncbi:hypothetical protein ACP70R_019150 [Stipagrostis hirtigluma subsp. patula]